MPTVQVLGGYRVLLTQELFDEAMALKYPLDMSAAERVEAEENLRQELGSVVLIEVIVVGTSQPPDLGGFGQPGSDQAAYDERYLSADGQRVLADSVHSLPVSSSYRVGF